MGKITTREEIILRYLEDPERLYYQINRFRIERSVEIRQAIVDLGDPKLAFAYSDNVDRYPRKDLREVACRSPRWAYNYARYVDYKPREETREGASKDVRIKDYYDIWESRKKRESLLKKKYVRVFGSKI